MKKHYKKIAALVCLVFMLGNLKIFALADSVDTGLDAKGISLSKDTFAMKYSGNPENRIQTYGELEDTISSAIALKNINVSKEEVESDIILKSANKTVMFHIKGQLQASYKTQNAVNSAILNISDSAGYRVLLFEIFNDTQKDNLLINQELNGIPHVKIYLEDSSEQLYMFEMKLPEEFINIQATRYPEAEIEKDSLWAKDLVQWETEEIETTDEILEEMGLGVTPFALYEYSRLVNSTTYHKSCYLGSDKADYYSLPYVDYMHANVGQSASIWTASFKVSEHAKIANVTYYGQNPIEYRNIKISFSGGQKTHICSTKRDGFVQNGQSPVVTGKNVSIILFDKVLSQMPGGVTVTTALGFINSMGQSSIQTIKLGDTHSLSSQYTIAAGEQLTGPYSVMRCTAIDGSETGHKFTCEATMQAYGSTSGSVNTVGALKVDFTKYDIEDTSSLQRSLSAQLNYTATR